MARPKHIAQSVARLTAETASKAPELPRYIPYLDSQMFYRAEFEPDVLVPALATFATIINAVAADLSAEVGTGFEQDKLLERLFPEMMDEWGGLCEVIAQSHYQPRFPWRPIDPPQPQNPLTPEDPSLPKKKERKQRFRRPPQFSFFQKGVTEFAQLVNKEWTKKGRDLAKDLEEYPKRAEAARQRRNELRLALATKLVAAGAEDLGERGNAADTICQYFNDRLTARSFYANDQFVEEAVSIEIESHRLCREAWLYIAWDYALARLEAGWKRFCFLTNQKYEPFDLSNSRRKFKLDGLYLDTTLWLRTSTLDRNTPAITLIGFGSSTSGAQSQRHCPLQ